MIQKELIQLIKTMSSSEKRTFKLYGNKQSGDKSYLYLFNIINKEAPDVIHQQFNKKFPGKNYESICRYLLKIITDSLVNTRKEKDKWFQQYQSLMRSRILMERSVTQYAYKELKHAQDLSHKIQDNLVYYLTCYLDVKYWSDNGFSGKSEDEIIQMHMCAKSSLRLLHKIQDQSSLFDTLKYRGLHSGKSFSKKDDEKLNDLLISELTLISREFHNNFESNKLHLLFQSFFFVNIGDYKSSLKCFYDLNDLFEQNESVWSSPPYEYLNTLEGILDNLRTIKQFSEMNFYIKKLDTLINKDYPENFKIIALQNIFIYKLVLLIHQQRIPEAKNLAESIPAHLLKDSTIPDYEKLTELLFTISLISFSEKKYAKAIRQLAVTTKFGTINFNLSIYKVTRLMQIIIHYELNDVDYLEYEIRSYKRTFKKIGKTSQIEKMIFAVIRLDPKKKSKYVKAVLWKKIAERIGGISENRYENQILKYYDFTNWIRSKLT